jgi:hypothetical protein
MTSQNHSTLTKIELYVIELLRNRGFCVVIWTPEEMGDTSASKLENVIIEHGNQIIQGSHD